MESSQRKQGFCQEIQSWKNHRFQQELSLIHICTTLSLQLEEAPRTEHRECAEVKRYLDANFREDVSVPPLLFWATRGTP